MVLYRCVLWLKCSSSLLLVCMCFSSEWCFSIGDGRWLLKCCEWFYS